MQVLRQKSEARTHKTFFNPYEISANPDVISANPAVISANPDVKALYNIIASMPKGVMLHAHFGAEVNMSNFIDHITEGFNSENKYMKYIYYAYDFEQIENFRRNLSDNIKKNSMNCTEYIKKDEDEDDLIDFTKISIDIKNSSYYDTKDFKFSNVPFNDQYPVVNGGLAYYTNGPPCPGFYSLYELITDVTFETLKNISYMKGINISTIQDDNIENRIFLIKKLIDFATRFQTPYDYEWPPLETLTHSFGGFIKSGIIFEKYFRYLLENEKKTNNIQGIELKSNVGKYHRKIPFKQYTHSDDNKVYTIYYGKHLEYEEYDIMTNIINELKTQNKILCNIIIGHYRFDNSTLLQIKCTKSKSYQIIRGIDVIANETCIGKGCASNYDFLDTFAKDCKHLGYSIHTGEAYDESKDPEKKSRQNIQSILQLKEMTKSTNQLPIRIGHGLTLNLPPTEIELEGLFYICKENISITLDKLYQTFIDYLKNLKIIQNNCFQLVNSIFRNEINITLFNDIIKCIINKYTNEYNEKEFKKTTNEIRKIIKDNSNLLFKKEKALEFQHKLLISHYISEDIHIELNPISNYMMGHIQKFSEHPGNNYLKLGLSVSINSDDASIFNYDSVNYDWLVALSTWDYFNNNIFMHSHITKKREQIRQIIRDEMITNNDINHVKSLSTDELLFITKIKNICEDSILNSFFSDEEKTKLMSTFKSEFLNWVSTVDLSNIDTLRRNSKLYFDKFDYTIPLNHNNRYYDYFMQIIHDKETIKSNESLSSAEFTVLDNLTIQDIETHHEEIFKTSEKSIITNQDDALIARYSQYNDNKLYPSLVKSTYTTFIIPLIKRILNIFDTYKTPETLTQRTSLVGGGSFYNKYMKYKNKYLELSGSKLRLNIKNVKLQPQNGGGSYYNKYLKYKNKYLELSESKKNNLCQKCNNYNCKCK